MSTTFDHFCEKDVDKKTLSGYFDIIRQIMWITI